MILTLLFYAVIPQSAMVVPKDLNCKAETQYYGSRTESCSFDTVVTAVHDTGRALQVECSRILVQCDDPAAASSSTNENPQNP